MGTRSSLGCLAGVVAVLAMGHAAAQGPAGPPGGSGLGGDRPILKQFDADGNGRLNQAERASAREWMAAQPPTGFAALMAGRGGPGGRAGGPPLGGGRGFAAATPGRRLSPSDVKPVSASTSFYDPRVLRTLFFDFENADWERELEAFYRTDVDVPATMIVDGRTYRDVGMHFRGASSFMFVPPGSKRSLNVTVDFTDEDQRLLGYRTLNLLNVNGDPTFVRPLLYSEIARRYLPASKVNYVRVVINGENWGVYANTEQFNADFVQERFGSRRGARWKVPGSPWGRGGMEYLDDDVARYRSIYDIKSADSPAAWRDLIALFKVLNTTPLDSLEKALEPVLDVDGTLRFLAVEVALVNTDGYWTRASDYNIYQDTKGRFHVLPHDVNEAFEEENFGGGRGRGLPPPGGATPRGGPPPAGPPSALPGLPAFPATFGMASVELDPLVGIDDTTKPLRSRLLAVPALRTRYLGYVRDVADKWLDWKTLEPMVRQHQALIAAEVKADTKKLYTFEAFEQRVAAGEDSLKSFADRRRAYLLKTVRP
jgi:spore coat protein CotH